VSDTGSPEPLVKNNDIDYFQMGKQTMGTPCHALKNRSDNKLYRIQTPQTPMVRPGMHDYYDIDNYPMGTNAVVAVISYTVSFCVGQERITLVV
jgi:DNA-directed RNA polymerase beta subunit